jgi:Ca-activated chloride channel homolog
MNFNLGAPQMLWLLPIVVAPLVLFLWWAWRKREELITRFISARLLGTLKVGVSPSRQKMRMVLLVLAVALLILALARPQWGYTWEEAKQRGLDILVAIDTSNSMLAEDVSPNRLARAKLATLDLMRRAKSDRLGLIAFAGSAFLTCPLTLDDAAFGQSVESLNTQTISQGGTAVAEAIDAARNAFKDEAENHKVLVLFTDGEDHDGGAVKAAEQASKEGLRIFTIGIGTPEGELLRIKDERGHVDYIRDEAGNPVKSRLDEALLQEIAQKTGGFYLPLRGARTMDMLYEQGLAPLPKATTSSKQLRRYHERFQWLLGLAIIVLLVEMFLPDRKRRRSSKTSAVAAPAALAGETMALLLLLALPLAGSGSPSRALRDYQDGKYKDALKEYNQLLEGKKDDPRLNFNAGAAAYQSRQLEEAAKQFGQALNSPDLQLQQRAYYNLGNTYYRLGEQGARQAQGPPAASMDPDASKKAWEEAVKHYDSALKLNPQDEDAKFNRAFVQERLEELKKQQQQQQSQSKDKSGGQQNQNQQNQSQNDSNKDQKQQQQQSQQQQSSSQQQQQPQQGSQSQEQKQRDEQASQDQRNSQQAQAQKRKDQAAKNDQKQGQSGQAEDKSKEEADREAALMAAGQMTPQQAQQLLDAEKGDERVLHLAPTNNPSSRSRTFKNW